MLITILYLHFTSEQAFQTCVLSEINDVFFIDPNRLCNLFIVSHLMEYAIIPNDSEVNYET